MKDVLGKDGLRSESRKDHKFAPRVPEVRRDPDQLLEGRFACLARLVRLSGLSPSRWIEKSSPARPNWDPY